MWTREGKGETPPQFSTLGFLMRGTLWGALAALGVAFFFITLGFLYELIASFAYLRYWIANALDLAFFEVTLAFMLGAVGGFTIAAFLQLLSLILQGRVSSLTGTLAGGSVGAIEGSLFLLLQLMLNPEGACTDSLCWALGILVYVGMPMAVGCWLGWRMVRYLHGTKPNG